MRTYVFGFCLMAICSSHAKTNSKLPADIKLCRPGDTDCVTTTASKLIRDYASKGYPAAAFPVVEPFHLKRFDISDGRSGSLNLKLSFRDIEVTGLSGVKFDRAVGFTADPTTSKFELYGTLQKLSMRGKYNADGRILILPIQGDGDADISVESPKFSVKFKPAVHSKNGESYLTVDKLKVLLEPKKMNIRLENLFNGDPTLGAHMNQFLNENWSEMWSELQPSVQMAISAIIKSILENMFKEFPYESLLDF